MSTEQQPSDPSIRFCMDCGEPVHAGASFCSRCGRAVGQGQDRPASAAEATTGSQHQAGPPFTYDPVQPYVNNYLAQAILVTIFCCLPLGIVAIVFAAQVNGKLASGDYAGAVSTSNTAKLLCWISFGIGLAVIVLWIGVLCVGLATAGWARG